MKKPQTRLGKVFSDQAPRTPSSGGGTGQPSSGTGPSFGTLGGLLGPVFGSLSPGGGSAGYGALSTGGGTLDDASVPAIHVNRFNVRVSSSVTRIAFGEALVGTNAAYRFAVSMSTADAKSLADLIYQLIAQVHSTSGGGGSSHG